MTNILCTILTTIVTNIADTFPASYPNAHPIPCPEGRIGCAVLHWDNGAPLYNYEDKTSTWTVTKREVCQFRWLDREWALTNSTVLTNWSKRWVAKLSTTTNWVEVPTASPGYWTNAILVGTNVLSLFDGVTVLVVTNKP